MAERSLNTFLSTTITGKYVHITWNQIPAAGAVYRWEYFKVLAVDEALRFVHLEPIQGARTNPYPGHKNHTEIVHLDDIKQISLENE